MAAASFTLLRKKLLESSASFMVLSVSWFLDHLRLYELLQPEGENGSVIFKSLMMYFRCTNMPGKDMAFRKGRKLGKVNMSHDAREDSQMDDYIARLPNR